MKPVTSFAKGTILSLLLTTCAAFTGCSDKAEELVPQDTRALDVQVKVQPTSRAMVKGTALAEGAGLGVNVTATDGGLYDGNDAGYLNILYTATGTGANQEWSSTTPVMLSGTEGKMYAYYPHTPGVDFKAIAVDITAQHDWMYSAEAYTVSDKSPSVAVTLKHAQTAVNVNMVRDATYTGVGAVSALSVTSEGLASGGTLDTRDGSWSALGGANTAISIISETFTLDGSTKSSQENPYMFIPASDATKDFVVTATVDGKTYSSSVTMKEVFAKGKMYSVSLKMTNVGLTVSEVTLVDWDEVLLDEGTFQPELAVTPDPYEGWMKLTYKIEEGQNISFDVYGDNFINEIAILKNGEVIYIGKNGYTHFQYSPIPGDYVVFIDLTNKTKMPEGLITRNVTSIVLPKTINYINDYAFDGAVALEKIIALPEKAPDITQYSFISICSAGLLVVPKNATGYGAWMNEHNIEADSWFLGGYNWKLIKDDYILKNNIYYSSDKKIIYGADGDISGDIVIDNTVETIKEYAFAECRNITSIILPNSVKTVDNYAFRNCIGLQQITFGKNVQTIWTRSLFGCSSLQSITSLAAIAPNINYETFRNIKKNGVLYISEGATGYDTWMQTDRYYLGYYNWTLQEITE